ncbi:hypothetical protein LTR62_003172 [Meristemomyces frigidus]|uniref:Uncharacterized protein n=1 Tax=Meristemomyces frigidus TaxID=1508187 RepID=A0AAN7YH77_9PEZI|nr:hypothetical protein LTR62_003172 [Meristemomyces frigidus]
MPSNKDRLYIALYARGGEARMPGLEDKYHWALIAGPKVENERSQGTRFHGKETITIVDGRARSTWIFERRSTSMRATTMILIRVMIGKIVSKERLESVFESTPVREGDPGWNCVGWVREALEGLERDGRALGTSITAWESVRDTAMRYVEAKKAQHRFDGQGSFDLTQVATWDMLTDKELIA